MPLNCIIGRCTKAIIKAESYKLAEEGLPGSSGTTATLRDAGSYDDFTSLLPQI